MRTILLASLLCVPLSAQTYVVTPAQYTRSEGSTSNSFPFTGVMRYQQVHGDLRGATRVLKSLAWRRGGGATNTTHIARVLDLEAFLGDGNYATFGSTFATNYVTAPQQVFTRKLVNAPDWTAQPDVAPAPFTLGIVFDTPYVFLGTNDLVYEILVYSSTSANAYLADAALPGNVSLKGPMTSAGTGCTTANGVMKLRADEANNSSTGKLTVNWDVTAGPVRAATAVLVGLTDPNLPLIGLCGTGVVHTDALVWTYNGLTAANGNMTTTNLSATWSPAYLGLLLTAQAAAIDPSQGGLGLAISNGVTSEAPPVPVPQQLMRLVANGSTTAATGGASVTPALITRFGY